MSRQHINAYRRTLAEQHRITGSLNERVLRKAFAELLERTGRSHDLVFTNEWEGRGPRGNNIAVDGALVPQILRKPFGYWEAKDSRDDLDREIAAKIASIIQGIQLWISEADCPNWGRQALKLCSPHVLVDE